MAKKSYKDLKKDGKVTLDSPKVKERKKFAPATKAEKVKKGKGSYNRKNAFEEDEEKTCWKGYEKKGTKKKSGKTVNNCVKESTNICNFLEALITKDHAKAHEYLKKTINDKLKMRIEQEIDTPLF